jgi:hypothetical protein
MKVNAITAPTCKFGDLLDGECFVYEGALFIRTAPALIDGSLITVAVRLIDGTVCFLSPGVKVSHAPNAKVVLE